MGNLVYVFRTPGLEDYRVGFNLKGTDRQIEVPIEITETMLHIAAMTHDMRTVMSMTMLDQLASLDTVIAIGASDSIPIQKAYNIGNMFGLEELFKRTVQSAMDKYVAAGYDLAKRIKEEEVKSK